MNERFHLETPEWLEAHLSDPAVTALDCRVRRIPRPNGPSFYESRRGDWEVERIPGAAYLHFNDDLADLAAPTPFTLASQAQIADALGRCGVTQTTKLVAYGDGADLGAHRVWWALSTFGHPDVRVLDGGLNRWKAEGRPLASGPTEFKPAEYALPTKRGDIARRDDVRAAIGDPGVCLINALSPEHFRGEGEQVFGRRGRIPGSVNIPAASVIDPATGCFRPVEEIRAMLDSRIPASVTRLIPYCGGGIAACTLALALTLAGRTDIAVYDGSLLEWSQDPDAPMEIG